MTIRFESLQKYSQAAVRGMGGCSSWPHLLTGTKGGSHFIPALAFSSVQGRFFKVCRLFLKLWNGLAMLWNNVPLNVRCSVMQCFQVRPILQLLKHFLAETLVFFQFDLFFLPSRHHLHFTLKHKCFLQNTPNQECLLKVQICGHLLFYLAQKN